jgi:hypothetical protein
MEIAGKFLSSLAWMVMMATWGGILLLAMLVVAGLVVWKSPRPARWLLLLPATWLVSLTLAMGISVPYPAAGESTPASVAAFAGLVGCCLIGPTFAWQTRTLSLLTVGWLVLNGLVTLSTLFLIGLIGFTT